MYVAAIRAFLPHSATPGRIDSAERELGDRLRGLVVRDGIRPPHEMVSTLWRVDCRASGDLVATCRSAPWTKGVKAGDEVIALIVCWSLANFGPIAAPMPYDVKNKYVIRRHPPRTLKTVPPDARPSLPEEPGEG